MPPKFQNSKFKYEYPSVEGNHHNSVSTRKKTIRRRIRRYCQMIYFENRLPNWIMLQQLGSGIHGTTYLVQSVNGDPKHYTMKVLRFQTNPETRQTSSYEEFLFEVIHHRVAERADPENVPAFYDAWVYDRIGYIIMEYIPIQQSTTQLVQVGSQIFTPLTTIAQFESCVSLWRQYLQSGICHADFKTVNLLYHATKKHYYLVDWGVAVCLDHFTTYELQTLLNYKLAEQYEERFEKNPHDGFLPVLFLMQKGVAVAIENNTLREFMTDVLFFEMLHRLHLCVHPPTLQQFLYQEIVESVKQWLPKFGMIKRAPTIAQFYPYFFETMDFIRDALWLYQIEKLKCEQLTIFVQSVVEKSSSTFFSNVHDSVSLYKRVAELYPIVQYFDQEMLMREFSKYNFCKVF